MYRIDSTLVALRRLLFVCLCLATAPAISSSSDCTEAAFTASEEFGVPTELLARIAMTESGWRGAQGWPWTVNAGGEGHYFETRSDAVRFAYGAIQHGTTGIDIGCFQINTLWHGQHFESVEEMFDPQRNARYAARFLRDLHGETGSWETAVGYYHSRDETRARAYRDRVFSKNLAPEQSESDRQARQAPPRTAPWMTINPGHPSTRSPGSLVALPALGSG
ncbi:MAG: hypothetical protein CSA72_02490 [Rhodobacterales bacterium]|nr:MAG: hypothetical protein CSA72_02490 [Rhodobacterales bacterium]